VLVRTFLTSAPAVAEWSAGGSGQCANWTEGNSSPSKIKLDVTSKISGDIRFYDDKRTEILLVS